MSMKKTVCIRVFGIVQGVGFRPTVSRHAAAHDICGSVCNMGPYVEIWAQGEENKVTDFCKTVKECPPERAVILRMDVEEPEEIPVFEEFSIIESGKVQGDIFVSPDIAICPKCKQELYDKKNRRYLHPFINCTCCGPRLTILDAMPYDRERTSMAEFPMCDECEYEYTHAETRRYDAQPVCCNDCGPQVYVIGREERGDDAIRYVRKVIRDGGIAAIKGIGGFHLCCDATSEAAVSLLRKRKKRPMKPFAVMMRDMETVKRECLLEDGQEDILDGYQKPILLLLGKEGGSICPAVAPGNPKIGVMLPYAPIQLLLFDYKDEVKMPDCLVMTSANTSGAPICRDDEDAIRELSGLCDVMLSHDRLIRLRADDTVMDYFQGEPYMIRRSRGYAPLPVMVKEKWTGEVLAIGGELKNTFCVGKNSLFYPSPYVGDMGDLRTLRALRESITRMTELLETKPKLLACDLHPGYNTTAAAEEMGLPLIKVQHHYAHILSCMAENDWNQPVIGVSFDGTGYGTDGTIWGGEFLLADYEGFTRMGSIQPFLQVGGDASAREGWRIAVSLLRDIYGEEEAGHKLERLDLCSKSMTKVQFTMAQRKINSVTSTSAGRLFDAVSAILGICRQSTFEGEASISLEFAAERWEKGQKETGKELLDFFKKDPDSFPYFPVTEIVDSFILPTHYLVQWLTEALLRGEEPDKLAWIFHGALAEMIVDGCIYIREKKGINAVALSGGVYQNHLLLSLSVQRLEEEGFQVLRHRLIPPNDGGISLGQAVAAMYALQKRQAEE
ncbi:MAG: carbamoyltransferase HypF [Lachnospiraceae bacterium]|nr:carbamoyltransferase HypF [Lachnospiraceae bacterium]